MVVVAQNHCPTAIHQARAIEAKFKRVLLLFSECHKKYDGNYISDGEIDELGKQSIITEPVYYCIITNYTFQRRR